MVFVASVGAPLGRCGEALWPMWVPAGMEGGSVAAISKLPRLPHRAKGLCYIGYRATRHRLQATGYIGPIAVAAIFLP